MFVCVHLWFVFYQSVIYWRIRMETKTLNAPDIHCGHCVMRVKRAVGALSGVRAVEADANTKDVTVTYDPSVVKLEAIKEALAAAGYPAA